MERNSALDGIRFLAITLVISSHCGILGQGGLGNCIFFTLSGFLAMGPFYKDSEERFTKIKSVLKYYLSRFLRIVPIYWICIIGVFFLIPTPFFSANDYESMHSLVYNLIFFKCFGHLWFLQQEMVFYLIFPFVAIIIFYIKRLFRRFTNKPDLFIAIIVIISAYLARKYITTDVFFLYGNAGEIDFKLSLFLIGIAGGYLYRFIDESGLNIKDNKKVYWLTEIYLITFLLFCVFSSVTFLKYVYSNYETFRVGWSMPFLCCYLTAIALILIMICGNTLTCRFLGNKLFSFIGKISFSMYIIHRFLLEIFDQPNKLCMFIIVYLVSVGLAIIMYYIVEKPLIVFKKAYSLSDVKKYYKSLL